METVILVLHPFLKKHLSRITKFFQAGDFESQPEARIGETSWQGKPHKIYTSSEYPLNHWLLWKGISYKTAPLSKI